MLAVGRPRRCTPRDRLCGPYTVAIVIVVYAVPIGVGVDGRTAAVLYPPRDRCCGPYTIAIVIGSVSSRVWQDIDTEYHALVIQCASWEDVPVKDLEAFKDQTKTKITTWGKNKGALLSGQRVDQAAEANKIIDKAKCLEKVAGALDAYQESYDVVRAKAFLAAMAEAKDVAVSLPGICQVQELNALASLEWDGGNHASSAKRLAYKDLTQHVSDMCAKSVISSFVKRCVEQILQKADNRSLTMEKLIEELMHVVNAAEVVTIGMDTADPFLPGYEGVRSARAARRRAVQGGYRAGGEPLGLF